MSKKVCANLWTWNIHIEAIEIKLNCHGKGQTTPFVDRPLQEDLYAGRQNCAAWETHTHNCQRTKGHRGFQDITNGMKPAAAATPKGVNDSLTMHPYCNGPIIIFSLNVELGLYQTLSKSFLFTLKTRSSLRILHKTSSYSLSTRILVSLLAIINSARR